MTNLTTLPDSAMTVYDTLAFPVWLFSVETLRVLASNRAAQNWLGYDSQAFQAMTIADLRPDCDRAHILERVNQFDGTEADAGVWTIVASSGHQYTASFIWHRVVFEGSEAVVASIHDITQIVGTQAHVRTLTAEVETLRRKATLSQEQLSSLVEKLPGKMLVLTPVEHEIVAVTDEYAQATMQNRDALLGRRLFDAFPDDPDDPEADGVRNLYNSLRRVEALRVTDVMNLQRYPVRKPDGAFEERFWLPRNKPVFDHSGQLIYIIHRAEDVTDLLRAADSGDAGALWLNKGEADGVLLVAEARVAFQALRERETRIRTAERLLALGSWEYDLEQHTFNWSQQAFEICGVPEHRGAPSFDSYVALVHPEDRQDMLASVRRFAETGAAEIEFQHKVIRDDGTVAYIRGVGARHRIEDREIVIGVVQDVTGFMRTQQQLKEAERLQRLAGYMARLGSWRVDLDPARVTWGPETADIHDVPGGISPTLDSAMEYYIPEHRERIRALFESCATEGHPFDDIFQIVTARGRHVWVRAIGGAARNEAGRIVAVEGALQDITEIVDFRAESQRMSNQLRDILEGMSDGFYLLDEDWRFAYVNGFAAAMLGKPREVLEGATFWEMFPEIMETTFEAMFLEARASGMSQRLTEYYAPFGRWFEVNAHPGTNGMGVYFRDVTEDRLAMQHRHLLDTAIQKLNEVVLITEAEPITAPDGPRITYVNDAITALTGYTPEEVINRTPRLFQGPKTAGPELERLRAAISHKRPAKVELVNYSRTRTPYWIELNLSPVTDTRGVCTHFIAIQRDITERKKAEDALLTAATHDDLTGLFNRAVLREALTAHLEELRERPGSLALLFMDIDHFKSVNDTMGHESGDGLLAEAARRIRGAVRDTDLVARISGDEFMVLATDSTAEDAVNLAQRLLDLFRLPFDLTGRRISLTVSIGVALAPQDGDDPDTLIRDADIALYRSKADGRNMFTRFAPKMREEAVRRIGIEQALQSSLLADNEDFWLVYQPQVTCDASRRLMGAEALLRWKGPETGSVGPAEFIPIAETTGLIRPLDQKVIVLAARQIAAWARAGIAVPVSVNVSAISMQTEGFAHEVLQCIDEHEVPRSLFQIEIVETVYLDATSTTQDNLVVLSQAGVVMSIDDFGTGHSSLEYLRRLPVRYLKMDRSFVAGVGIGSQNDDALAAAILAMARALKMEVIAEGVETEVQFDWLAQKGCAQVQGFLTGRPVEPEPFAAHHLR